MIEKTVGQILNETVNLFPKNNALIYIERNLGYTYKEFKVKCDQIAKGLMALGIKRGNHIAVWAYNVPEWVFLQFASATIGAVLVTVNTYYKSHELKYLLKQSDVTTLFLVDGFKDVDYIKQVHAILPDLTTYDPNKIESKEFPLLKNIVYIGEKNHKDMLHFDDLIKLGKRISNEELYKRLESLDPHDVINMQYTSGTTGFPKGVMLTHYNIVNNAFFVGENMGLTEIDKLCIPVPFFHCFGCVLSTLNCVVHASTMVPIEIFDAEAVLKAVEKERCTALQGVPTMFIAELKHPNFEQYNLSSLRTGIMAGSSCPIDVMVDAMSKMNLQQITICYGLTETSPVLTQTRRDDPVNKRVETVGKPITGVKVKIIDPETGKILSPGKPGELVASGFGVMKGYYKMPDKTNETIIDGWLYTKDLAVEDEDGYISILGRIDDMIIRGGENVYPREIEEFLHTNEKIHNVAIVGVPNEKYGEEVCAFIKLKNSYKATEEEIKEYCRDGISRFKIPKYVIFTEEFPMTASGKIRKIDLREMASQQLHLSKP
jgi:fatty-acyl-CoA synthase